jgi:predicted nucleotidyltransferase
MGRIREINMQKPTKASLYELCDRLKREKRELEYELGHKIEKLEKELERERRKPGVEQKLRQILGDMKLKRENQIRLRNFL